MFMEGGEMHLRLCGSQAQAHDNSLTMELGRSRQQAQPEAARSALYGCHAGSFPRCHPSADAGDRQ